MGAGKGFRKFAARGLRASIMVIVVLVWAVGIHFAISNLPIPRLLASETYHDFGDVPPSVVLHTVILSNVGKSDLTILNMWTSCGCTSARLNTSGIESPEFGTKGDAAFGTAWQAKLRPGGSAQLIVRFDPGKTDGYFTGTRIVFIQTDDPSQKVFQFTIAVHEIP